MIGYTITREDLEEQADVVKTLVLSVLVNDGFLDKQAADDWASKHTIIGRRKTIFRTVTNLWRKTAEHDGLFWIVVESKDER